MPSITKQHLEGIQFSQQFSNRRDSPLDSLDIVKFFLLDCDPNVTLQKGEGKSPLHCACRLNYNDSNIVVLLKSSR
eukprot:scaffold20381_cov75-Skeletonema_dohrnii-CCMP3373.AAC.3